ncbi:MAG: redox-sensing transcriptional repressor Rex [Bacteroidales bacterium]|nr:redox-sensing transcriptional repressor Rex [Bacteroidales bacterium]MCF6341864.1 redox-sensing transcriptional repressor Rex [Bacteroidales bacterium]
MDAIHAFEHLPHKTIERLSQYRRALLICLEEGKSHIFSHEIARIQHITPVQVRRDLMLIGYSGTLRKGYNIEQLIELIGEIIDSEEMIKVAVMGLGDLGHAILNYFNGKRSKLSIVAGFDVNPKKIGTVFNGVPCYPVEQIQEIINRENISIGIITVPAKQAPVTAGRLIKAGIKGILNYTPTPIQVPEDVYLEEYDMITTLEKLAFYVKLANDKNKL